MNRQDLIHAKHAVERAVRACEDAGLDTFVLRQEAERIGNKMDSREKPQWQRPSRLAANAPRPEDVGLQQRPTQGALAPPEMDQKEQQDCYESSFRALSAGVDAIVTRLVPTYGTRIVRYSLHGALLQLANGLRNHPGLNVQSFPWQQQKEALP